MKKLLFLLLVAIFLIISQLLLQKNNNLEVKSPKSRTNLPTIPIISTPTPTPNITLGLMGDLGLGRHITATARAKNDFSWSLSGVASWLQQNDFNLANLESPVIKNCPEGKTGTFTFCGDPQFIPYLKQNKFVFNLNNNHILNYGIDGVIQTKDFLGTDYVYDNFYQKTVNDISFGFLGFDFITYPNLDKEMILRKVSQYNPQVDWLIVSLHWGNEYLAVPEAWRVKFAHELIDHGADIIHGHHPHVLQSIETYQDKLILYSLGNFVFDQSWSFETSHSQMIRLTLDKTKVLNLQKVPITIKYNSRPEIDP